MAPVLRVADRYWLKNVSRWLGPKIPDWIPRNFYVFAPNHTLKVCLYAYMYACTCAFIYFCSSLFIQIYALNSLGDVDYNIYRFFFWFHIFIIHFILVYPNNFSFSFASAAVASASSIILSSIDVFGPKVQNLVDHHEPLHHKNWPLEFHLYSPGCPNLFNPSLPPLEHITLPSVNISDSALDGVVRCAGVKGGETGPYQYVDIKDALIKVSPVMSVYTRSGGRSWYQQMKGRGSSLTLPSPN